MGRQIVIFFLLTLITANSPMFAMELNLFAALKKASGETDDMAILKERLNMNHYEIEGIKSALFPVVQFSTGLNYLSISSKSFPPYFTEVPSDGGGGGASFPSRFYGSEINWNLSFRQPLFTFGRLGVLIKIARKTQDINNLNYDIEKEKYYFNALSSWTTAYLAQHQLQTSLKSLERLRQIKDFTEINFKMGGSSKLDAMRSESRLMLAMGDSSQLEINARQSLESLKHLLGIDSAADVSIARNNNEDSWVQANMASKGRKELEIQKLNREITQHWAQYERANLLPAIYLSGGMDNKVQEYDTEFDIVPPSPSGLVDPDYFNYRLGIQMDWTLFDGFKTTSAVHRRKAEANLELRKWNKLKNSLELAQKEAKNSREAAEAMVVASELAVKAARTAYEIAQTDYKSGQLSIHQLLEIDEEFRMAEFRWASAWTNLILSHANERIANGISLMEGIH